MVLRLHGSVRDGWYCPRPWHSHSHHNWPVAVRDGSSAVSPSTILKNVWFVPDWTVSYYRPREWTPGDCPIVVVVESLPWRPFDPWVTSAIYHDWHHCSSVHRHEADPVVSSPCDHDWVDPTTTTPTTCVACNLHIPPPPHYHHPPPPFWRDRSVRGWLDPSRSRDHLPVLPRPMVNPNHSASFWYHPHPHWYHSHHHWESLGRPPTRWISPWMRRRYWNHRDETPVPTPWEYHCGRRFPSATVTLFVVVVAWLWMVVTLLLLLLLLLLLVVVVAITVVRVSTCGPSVEWLYPRRLEILVGTAPVAAIPVVWFPAPHHQRQKWDVYYNRANDKFDERNQWYERRRWLSPWRDPGWPWWIGPTRYWRQWPAFRTTHCPERPDGPWVITNAIGPWHPFGLVCNWWCNIYIYILYIIGNTRVRWWRNMIR